MRRGPLFFLVLFATVLVSDVLRGGCERLERNPQCNGSIADCYEGIEELMESEMSSSPLQVVKYLGYYSLRPDVIVGFGEAPMPGQAYRRQCRLDLYCRERSQ